MMLTLAVDTVTATGSVALALDGKTVAEHVFVDRQHAAQLLPGIMMCLQTAGRRPADVDQVLIADGPGSFTGIRIGFATVAGLVAETTAEVFVTSSMLASAVAISRDSGGPTVAMYDALRGEVYAGVYSVRDNAVVVVREPTLTPVEALRDLTDDTPTDAVGDGAISYAHEVEAWIGKPPRNTPAHARNLLAMRHLENGLRKVHGFVSFDPTYGRQAEAQVRWERQHGRRLPDSPGAS